MKTIAQKPRYSVREAAERLGVHSTTVWRWCHRGVRGRKLCTVLVGGRRYIVARDLDRFLGDGQRCYSPDGNGIAGASRI